MSQQFSREGQNHLEAIEALIAKVHLRSGRSMPDQFEPSPLDALLAKEEGVPEDHYCAGVAMLQGFLTWVFEGGPHPAPAVQRLYTVANALAPQLLLNMSNEEIAAIFGQGRAAESARTIMLNKKLATAGFKHTRFRHQKSDTARRRMSRAQLGNDNRRKKSAA